jgi:hypothetical protein
MSTCPAPLGCEPACSRAANSISARRRRSACPRPPCCCATASPTSSGSRPANPAVHGHRPADGQRHRRAARRRAGADGNRGGAQDREFGGHAAGRQAHLHLGAGRRRHHHRRVPPRKAHAGGGRRRARRGVAHARRPARRPARPGHHQGQPGRRADPHLHRGIKAHGRRGAVLVRRQRRHQGACWPCAAWARWRASAASRARCRSTRPGPPARAGRHRGRHFAPAAPGAAGRLGRPRRHRRRRAVGAHHRHGGSRPRKLARMEIPLPTGRRPARPGGRVADTVAERRSAALLNGQPVVGFEVRSRGASEVERRRGRARRAGKAESRSTPISASTEAFNFVDPVQENFDGSMCCCTKARCWRCWWSGCSCATGAPRWCRRWRCRCRSSRPSRHVLLLGFSLNVVTLLSLSLVVGILVDDAIVEIENIMRHLRMGKTPYQAAMEAADEIGLAVIATTFTLIAVFLPTAFMSGVAGKFFKQFGWTAAHRGVFSLVVARLLTPMMAAYCCKPRARQASRPGCASILAGRLVPEAPHPDRAGGRCAFFVGSLCAGAAAAHRLHPARRPVADPGEASSCRRAAPRPDAGAAEQARRWSKNPHVKLRLHRRRRRRGRRDPFAGGAQPRCARPR